MEQINPNIKGESVKVLGRIIVFLLYYVFLTMIGVAIFIGAFFLSKLVLVYVVPDLGSGRALIYLLLMLLGIWCLALMFGLYLIKPLFSFSKNEKADRVEVTAKDCPELFNIINELADTVGTKRPKHVYLTTDVNACVFYDTSFWSIFFPVRKNLEIGLGLFDGTNIEEVKSILAHEFGHFSQKSMKVGSTVYVANSILYNLVCAEDWWDRLLDKWEMSDTSVFRWFGIITRNLTSGIKHLNAKLYRFVQKAYMKLSRQMEFDADNISCAVVGSKVFTSAMCKIEILADEDNRYHDYVNALIGENKMVCNYFACRKISDKLNPDTSVPELKYDVLMTGPLENVNSPSRIEIKNVWDSHPTLKERLDNAAASGYVGEPVTPVPSWSLISDSVQQKVSDQLLGQVKPDPENPFSTISEEDFSAWTTAYLKEYSIPENIKPFVAREIIVFDPQDLPVLSGCPINDTNAQILSDYETASRDMDILNEVRSGAISARELSYLGTVYKKDNLPIDLHTEYLNTLFAKAKDIDASIYAYLHNVVKNEEAKDEVDSIYASIFYASHHFGKELAELQTKRDALYAELSRVTRREQDEYNALCTAVVDFEQYFRGIINTCDWKLLRREVGSENEQFMLDYAAHTHNLSHSINVDEINKIFSMIDALVNMHKALYAKEKRELGKLILLAMNTEETTPLQ